MVIVMSMVGNGNCNGNGDGDGYGDGDRSKDDDDAIRSASTVMRTDISNKPDQMRSLDA